MSQQKRDHQKLQQQLTTKKETCWDRWSEATIKKVFTFAEGYKEFLTKAKTEREGVREGVRIAKENGFVDLEEKKEVKPGDKIYFIHRGKSVIFARIGNKGLEQGAKMIISHIDAPHLDLKVSPLYEEENTAFLKTHYYGGIKKYQWPTIALALHGKVYLRDGKEVDINIGEKESDPVFMITDLLPHLDRTGGPGTPTNNREVEGEHLNMVVGSIPVKVGKGTKMEEKVKLAILEYLYDHYGMVEEDLASAELQAVPSERPRDLGFDRSMISAYAHDDRICCYSSLQSLFQSQGADQTQVCMWVDREEIGSEGTTSAQSVFIERFLSLVYEKITGGHSSISDIYKIFSNSQGVSADVTGALDPDYKDVHEPRNAPRMHYGLAIEKYTGAKGKLSTSEASGGFMRELRNTFGKDKNILYQMGGGIGKIDQGGGGTIAKFMANRDIDIVDMGVPLFNMHAPLEIASKGDLYCAYLGYKGFLEE